MKRRVWKCKTGVKDRNQLRSGTGAGTGGHFPQCCHTDLRRAASSGIPRQISRSKRPALRRAGSRESGLFVAPMTMTGAGRLFRSDRNKGNTVAVCFVVHLVPLISYPGSKDDKAHARFQKLSNKHRNMPRRGERSTMRGEKARKKGGSVECQERFQWVRQPC